MFEFLALIILIAGLCLIIPLIGFLLKVVFKVALIPLTILGFILKAVMLILGVVLCLIFGLPALILLLVAIPFLIIGSLLWAGVKTVAVFA